MYQPYATYPSAVPPEPAPPAPKPVRRAVLAMYAGAAASVLGIAVELMLLNSIKNQLLQHMTPAPNMTAQEFASVKHMMSVSITTFGTVVVVVSGIVGAGLWLWMAWKCKTGRSWARIVSTVLFGINTVGLLPMSVGDYGTIGILPWLWHFAGWLPGLAALILLWQRSSSDFFRAAAAPRY